MSSHQTPISESEGHLEGEKKRGQVTTNKWSVVQKSKQLFFIN